MKACFIGHRITNHQTDFVVEMDKITDDFCFIATQKEDDLSVDKKYLSKSILYCREMKKKIMQSDMVILGSASEKLVAKRLKKRKLTFRYSERFYKNGFRKKQLVRNAFSSWLHHGRFNRFPFYMLCASAYTSSDCSLFNNYINRCYKWGYFPKENIYPDIDKLISNKKPNSILWVGRFLDWKHPEYAVELAKALKDNNIPFSMEIGGDGNEYENVSSLIKKYKLKKEVKLLGVLSQEEVKEKMENSSIFIQTSDFREGWGAVVNEAMNSACAVVSSHAVGSAPYLIKDMHNGIIFENGNIKDLVKKVKLLLNDRELTNDLGKNAYKTITTLWNAKIAATRLCELSKAILNGEKTPDLYKDGPCSKAEVLKNDWYPIKENR